MNDELKFDPDALRKEFADYCTEVEPGIKAKAPRLNQLETLALIGMTVFQAAKELKHEKAASIAALEAANARIAELEATIRKQANAARSLADATIRDASIRQGLAEKAYAESSPEVLASERQANAMLTEENERLTARLAALESAAKAEPVAEVVGSSEICWVRVTSNGLKPGDKLYTALAQPLEAQADARWQPIETAPKDGTEVLLIATLYSMLMPYPERIVGAYRNGWWSGPATLSHVTHWQPLPAAPAALSQKAGEQQ